MKGFEVRVVIVLLKSIKTRDVAKELGTFVCYAMNKSELLKKIHKAKGFKGISFSNLINYETEEYKEEEMYSFYVRTTSEKVAQEFASVFSDLENDNFIVTDVEFYSTDINRLIDSIVTSSPAICSIFDKEQSKVLSWTTRYGNEILEDSIVNNLVKKYNTINGTSFKVEKKDVIDKFTLIKDFPTVINYKRGSTFLGYRFEIKFKKNSIAQEIASTAYFLGVGSKNSILPVGFTRANYINS